MCTEKLDFESHGRSDGPWTLQWRQTEWRWRSQSSIAPWTPVWIINGGVVGKMGPIAPFSQMRQLWGQPEWRSGSASLCHKEMSETERISKSERHGALCKSIDSFYPRSIKSSCENWSDQGATFDINKLGGSPTPSIQRLDMGKWLELWR